MTVAAPETLVRVTGLRKTFGDFVAVDGVDIEVNAGEIVGLLGKNGAGKSTVIKILAGVERADAGDIELCGHQVRPERHTTAQARALGLAVMFQELEIYPGMTVAENVALGTRLPHRFGGLVDDSRLNERVRQTLLTVNPAIDPKADVDTLGPAEQRAVMIARAVYQGARLLVLDEPTTSLTAREITALHDLVHRLAAAGHGIIYVSHRLEEIVEVTDRVVVMRDARVVAERQTAELTIHDLISAITGKATGSTAAERRIERGVDARVPGPVRLAVSGLRRTDSVHDVGFEVHAGEILGIGGLVGSGRTEVLRAIFGADRRDGGSIVLDGEPLAISSPRDAIRAGIVLLPEDRRHQGLIESFCIRENVTLATLPKFRRGLPMPSKRREYGVTHRLMSDLRMRATGPEQIVGSLSGGTQQKVVIAKWLLRDGKILMFDEPTQGIDVDAKEEVYTLMEEFAASGAAVVLVSADFAELVAVCDRVIVLREGRLVETLSGTAVTEAAIIAACYGGNER